MSFLKMYPARNGDSFLIKSDERTRTAILVDGGYASTFDQHILPDLQTLAKDGYSLDLVVATHIDADHISGLLRLFKSNGNARTPNIIPIKGVWHNSLRTLMPAETEERQVRSDDMDLLSEICRRGYPPSYGPADQAEIGARQGSSLAALLLGGEYVWNGGDGRQHIDSSSAQPIKITPMAQAIVIGPPARRLDTLRESWVSQLRQLGLVGNIAPDAPFDDAFEFLSSFADLKASVTPRTISGQVQRDRQLREVYAADNSETNGSSISFVLQIDSNQILMLGDSWAEDSVSALKSVSSGPLVYDAIKLSHHGSLRNTSPALLETIDSPRFFISTNGERHNHPDIEVLRAIVDRPATFSRNLYFNYSTPASQILRAYRSSTGPGFNIHENNTEWILISPGAHDR